MFDENWQSEQHSSIASSQADPCVYLQVKGLQHLLPAHEASPPQSQSSPSSTTPLPHSEIVFSFTFLLFTRHDDETSFEPKPLQILPMLQGEKVDSLIEAVGFMRYADPALQTEPLRGQHTGELPTSPEEHPVAQSWTAPKLCPSSCARTSHSKLLEVTTLVEEIVSFAVEIRNSITALGIVYTYRRRLTCRCTLCPPKRDLLRYLQCSRSLMSKQPLDHRSVLRAMN